MAVPTKQYGLILSQKKGALKNLQKPSVFGDDSDDETTVGESLQREAIKKRMMKQTRLEMQKALEEDSTVYDYDGVYDDIQKQRIESNKKILGGADKKPKYIQHLMKAVEDRKKEQERREERKIQKEREAEGEKFSDKDAYVTSAYKLKLQEQKEELEREKREAQIEAALDVKKQKDLSGFYRHLLNQTVGEEEIPDRSANKARSPKERERDKNGEREKSRNPVEDEREDKDGEEEKEKRKEAEKEKTVKKEETDPENKEEAGEKGKGKEEMEGKVNKFAKRSTDQTVGTARDRYMARQMARSSCKSYIEKEED
ncbi:putative nuclear speckle splicing regulatory protein 1 [Scophthalmus maximus]|uniref:Nuclear speckle splicing regulatory protein 1 n=1 Tax=Scophthalmus maximus TaxID=52904 RepID=A0A2U9B7U4_SCOMX|nr:putative nuclear speckle splicing regulatory protein 1 [Scophthalmus maximus]